MERITGTLSGNNLTSYTRAIDNSTEQAHSAGAVIEMVWNATDWNSLVSGFLVGHSQTGSHAASSIVAGNLAACSVSAGNLNFTAGDVTLTGSETLTNKRVTPRITTAASYTTDTGTSLNIDNCDEFDVTAQAGALLFNAPSGTPTNGQRLIIRITGTAARALTYNAIFAASTDLALPTTTTTTKTMYMGFFYNSTAAKWQLTAALDNFA